MCGIAGFIAVRNGDGGTLEAPRQVIAMLHAQAHRGPDGVGLSAWDTEAGWRSSYATRAGELSQGEAQSPRCVLGHNWLAVQDQSAPARQPMFEGETGLVFNGEIYNFPELREPLEKAGRVFRTHSDTEVLLKLWQEHGVRCLWELRGMYAFAAFDPRDQSLALVRDPFGIKPLYYALAAGGVYFASEIRALHAAGIVRRAIRPTAALASATAGVNKFDAHQTLYEGIYELPPGHWMRVEASGKIDLRRYYSLPEPAGDLRGEEAEQLLRSALDESVRVHLRASRRIATCLSGGLDSSNLALLIAKHKELAGHEFAAFTICTAGAEDSEVALARELTASAGLRHHVSERCQPIAPVDVLEMVTAYEVPNHVIGPINQFLLLRQVAAAGATVVLDGQGGDELVSGYPWYAPVVLEAVRRQGGDAETLAELRRQKAPLKSPTLEAFDRMFHDADYWVRNQLSGRDFLGIGAEEVLALPETQYYLAGGGEWTSFRQRQYFQGELQYLLRQEDRIGMWFGLECRVPFVDRLMVASAARLAPDWLLHEGYTKYPLRVLLPELPDSIRWNTRKRGFWETDVSQFGWLSDFGLRVATESTLLRELFPGDRIAAGWAGLSFDQQWRLTQLAVLERCATRDEARELAAEAPAAAAGACT